MTEQEIIKIYEENRALLKGHFLLSSGMHSDAYLQSERVMQHPYIASCIVSELSKMLYNIEFSVIVSPAVGGIRFGYELSRQLNKRSLFTERVEGVMQFKRGFELFEGERVLVAEDVVTTGKSTKECMAAVEAAGGKVIGVASIIDRSVGQVDFGVPFFPLAAVDVKSYEADNCPICKTGLALVKPGSRIFTK